jgi:flavin-binding protein dodecin
MSVYKVIEIIGTSGQSWEDAATTALKTAGESVRDLRVAEVIQHDIDVGDGGGITFRTKLRVSFKYEGSD